MKKFLALAISLAFLCGAVACGTTPADSHSSQDSASDSASSSSNSSSETPKPVDYTWNTQPKVKEVFYDDFSQGLKSENWTSTDNGWGENNNGVTSKNVMYSTDKQKVEAEGATGGLVVLKATGDYAADKNKKRQGAVVITRNDYGAGKYEARLKVLPRQGQCTALWTYFNGTPNATNLEDSKYSEIDIELPEKGDFRQMSATTYEKFIDKKNMNQTTSRINFEQKGMGDLSLNDGEWHTFSFEWRTAENDTGIIWYVDGQSVVKYTTDVPKYTAPFWIGTHFPDNPGWLGVPNFDTAYMYLDWVKITSYDEPTIDESNGSAGEFTFRDLGDEDIPHTDYAANGDFSQGTADSAVAWEADMGSHIVRGVKNYVSYLQVDSGNTIYQTIDSKYKGHKMQLVVNGKKLSGDGNMRVYIEEYYGGILPKGQSDPLVFKHTIAGEKSVTYQLKDPKTDSLRIVIETDEGTVGEVTSVKLYMVK